MKTYKKLFEKLYSLENLTLAFKKARKGKTKKKYVRDFEEDFAHNLQRLQEELQTKTYVPRPLSTFILRDPKTRKICVSDFRDRIVHHAICNLLEPIFERLFIYDSYANRKGKGALAALQRFDEFKRKVSNNGRCLRRTRDSNHVRGFVLKADVKQYFENVEHQVLMKILELKVPDQDFLEVIRKILVNYDGKKKGKGMPLGNLTSQFFANVYLNELDHFVKESLKAKYYVRYVDDFVILHSLRSQLYEWKKSINAFLKSELSLELHPQKSQIKPLGQGVDFLGFRCFYYFRLLRKRNMRKMEQRLQRQSALLKEGLINSVQVLESTQGWNAYASHANTFKLRRRFMNEVIKLIQKPIDSSVV